MPITSLISAVMIWTASVKLCGNSSVFVNGEFKYIEHIKEVIYRLNIVTHWKGLPERTNAADLARIAQIPRNRRSHQASQYWKILILTVADTTLIQNSRNPYLNYPTRWYIPLTKDGIIEYFILLLPTIIQYTVYYVKFLVLIRLLMK